MTTEMLETLMYSFMMLGVLLLIGVFLRAKIPFLRKLLIPASIIGGIVGMLLNPSVLGKTGFNLFPAEWINIWSLLPGILVMPLFASLPLCNFKNKNAPKLSAFPKRKLYSILMTSFIRCPTFALQMFFGVGTALLIGGFFPNLFFYPTFGCEMPHGFNGSHSLAAVLGNVMKGANLEYWELGQSIGQAYATIGLIGGIVMGIFFINRAIRLGRTQIITSASTLSDKITYGYVRNVEEQESIGRETTESSNANTVTIHLALVLIVSFLGYCVHLLLAYLNLGFLADMPAYLWAMMLAYPVNFVMNQLDLGWLFDRKTKLIVTGVCTDFVVLSALASINVDIIITYLIPILIISCIGFIISYLMTFVAFRYFMRGNYDFERAIAIWGTETGFAATQLALLQIVDPGFKSPVLEELNFASVIFNAKDIIFVPLYLAFISSENPTMLLIVAAIEITVMYIAAFITKHFYDKEWKPEKVTS